MPIEIERKFLVVNDNWKAQVESRASLKQGYLASQSNATIRVRVADGRAQLNIKGPTRGISRLEYEYDIPPRDAEEILDRLAEGAVIEKERYKVRCGGHVWDLDVFQGDNAGLVVAEVELASEAEHFEMPDWAGEEVSGDARYYNASLVKHPFTCW
jgi:adenylate cyclase